MAGCLRWPLALLACLLPAWPIGAFEARDAATLKAEFLGNFAEFVRWPGESDGHFRLCVFGQDDSGAALAALAGRRLRAMTVVVNHAVPESGLSDCHMVWLPAAQSHRLEQVLVITHNRPVLVVAEKAGMAGLGAAISLLPRPDGRLGFDVNLEAARARNLQVSSRLTALAHRVY